MANDQKPVISVRKLRKVYMMGQEHVVALHNIDLDIPRGEVCCIFGTSGSGKSTLLNQLAGLEKPTRGVVRIGGVPISQLNENQLAAFRQKHIGFVFQSYNLLPELTAAENVAMPLMFKGIDPDVRLLEAKKMLCRVGLKDRMDHFPNQMSGGQQQRVGIARAFVTRPEVVFADEPTGNLDSVSSAEVLSFLKRSVKELGQTVIMVTHDAVAASYADRAIVFADGQIVADEQRPTAESMNQLLMNERERATQLVGGPSAGTTVPRPPVAALKGHTEKASFVPGAPSVPGAPQHAAVAQHRR